MTQDEYDTGTPRTPEEARIQKLEERMEDMVDVRDLRELVESWRYENAVPAGQQGAYQVADAFEKCADEVEELLEDE